MFPGKIQFKSLRWSIIVHVPRIYNVKYCLLRSSCDLAKNLLAHAFCKEVVGHEAMNLVDVSSYTLRSRDWYLPPVERSRLARRMKTANA